MKDKGFAQNVNRDDLVRGAEELGVNLDEHICFVVESMKPVASLIGLNPSGMLERLEIFNRLRLGLRLRQPEAAKAGPFAIPRQDSSLDSPSDVLAPLEEAAVTAKSTLVPAVEQ